jgi:hydrophobic/amphiphilic exporter-1 (mainly G- bacteria), HAE1 family
MNENHLVGQCIRYPITVIVGILFILYFGFLSLFSIPIQLTPDITRPVITVETAWPGASPMEIEREIIERQEEVLKSLEGLLNMGSSARPNRAEIKLEFSPGTDIDSALLKVNNQLGRVKKYPSEADKPVLRSSGERENAIAWFVLVPEDNESSLYVPHLREFVEDEIESLFERVKGVAAANVFGGQKREVRVEFRPELLAARGLTIPQVLQRLREEGKDFSGGRIDEGKRRHIVRTLGAYKSTLEIENLILRESPRERTYLRDVATVRITHKDANSLVRQKGAPSIALNVQRKIGSNLLDTMEELKKVVENLNSGILKQRKLKLIQAYDSSSYVKSSLSLVRQNMILGGFLAIAVLFFFLRSTIPTLIVSCAIPISAVGTFLGLFLMGRNINLVSLAGISFAVGMLVDNAIVVQENIFTRLQLKDNPIQAAINGTREVWGAILASTLTTVVVFIPILFMEAEIAQLFRDIALAISCAVSLSLIVSVLVIPTFSAYLMNDLESSKHHKDEGWGHTLAQKIGTVCKSPALRIYTILGLTLGSLVGSWLLSPPADYLPQGSRNLIFSVLIPPPGYNLDELVRIGENLEKDLKPLWTGPDAKIETFFFVAAGTRVFMGFRAANSDLVEPLMKNVQAKLSRIPGMIAVVVRAGLFGRGLSSGRSIDLKLTGPELEPLVAMAREAFGSVRKNLKGVQARPKPSLALGQPELHVVAKKQSLAEAGWSHKNLGTIVEALVDGVRVADYRLSDGKIIDLVFRADQSAYSHTQDLGKTPLYIPKKGVAVLESLATLKHSMGPTEIHHHERERAITISMNIPRTIPMESAMETVKTKIIKPLEQSGKLVPPYGWKIAGTADKLTSTRQELQGLFLTALLVIYLLMAALFQSFLYPLIILFTVPLAGLGGFLALRLVNLWVAPQSLDVLTMLGFVILLGIVVNNAILLVDRTLRNIREGHKSPLESITEAVSNRIRPIFMSTLTSVFGMAPLVVMTGPGSEIYRGIGSVVVGGLLVSTLFTLVLIPAILAVTLDIQARLFTQKEI